MEAEGQQLNLFADALEHQLDRLRVAMTAHDDGTCTAVADAGGFTIETTFEWV